MSIPGVLGVLIIKGKPLAVQRNMELRRA